MNKQREAMQFALATLEDIFGKKKIDVTAINMLREALADDEPDWRHPKIQSLIGAKARHQIELRLVEQLLDNAYFETTASDMEYWNTLHDKLHKFLTEARKPLTDNTLWEMWVESPSDVMRFARAIERAHGIGEP